MPFVLRPVESEDVRNLLKTKQTVSENIQLTQSQVALKDNKNSGDQFVEPDEHDKIVVDEAPITFYPTVPVYVVRPSEDPSSWPPLGTYENEKLIWHPDKKPIKLTKKEKAEKKRLENEAKAEKKRKEAEVTTKLVTQLFILILGEKERQGSETTQERIVGCDGRIEARRAQLIKCQC